MLNFWEFVCFFGSPGNPGSGPGLPGLRGKNPGSPGPGRAQKILSRCTPSPNLGPNWSTWTQNYGPLWYWWKKIFEISKLSFVIISIVFCWGRLLRFFYLLLQFSRFLQTFFCKMLVRGLSRSYIERIFEFVPTKNLARWPS